MIKYVISLTKLTDHGSWSTTPKWKERKQGRVKTIEPNFRKERGKAEPFGSKSKKEVALNRRVDFALIFTFSLFM